MAGALTWQLPTKLARRLPALGGMHATAGQCLAPWPAPRQVNDEMDVGAEATKRVRRLQREFNKLLINVCRPAAYCARPPAAGPHRPHVAPAATRAAACLSRGWGDERSPASPAPPTLFSFLAPPDCAARPYMACCCTQAKPEEEERVARDRLLLEAKGLLGNREKAARKLMKLSERDRAELEARGLLNAKGLKLPSARADRCGPGLSLASGKGHCASQGIQQAHVCGQAGWPLCDHGRR